MDKEFAPIEQNDSLPITPSNASSKRVRFTFILTVLGWMGGFICVQVIGGLIYCVLSAIISYLLYDDFAMVWELEHFTFACSLASAIFMPCVCMLLAASKKEVGKSFKQKFSDYTHIHRLPVVQCLQYIAIGVFMAFISGLIVTMIVLLFDNENLLGSAINIEYTVLSGVSVIFFAPIGEEILMRCLVFDTLKKYQSEKRANVSQSILFGLLHGVSLQTLYTAFFGWFVGREVQKNNNLTCSLMMHLGFNLGAGLNCIFPTLGDFPIYNIGILIVSFYGCYVFGNILIQDRKTKTIERSD